jgi:hypothetical protein
MTPTPKARVPSNIDLAGLVAMLKVRKERRKRRKKKGTKKEKDKVGDKPLIMRDNSNNVQMRIGSELLNEVQQNSLSAVRRQKRTNDLAQAHLVFRRVVHSHPER